MSSIKNKAYVQIRYYNTLAVSFLIPFGGDILAISVLLLFINWLLEGRFKYKFSSIEYPKLTLAFTGFYILQLLGLLYSSNITNGLSEVQIKLSLFFMPFVFLVNRDLEQKKVRNVLYAFILGCFFASAFSILYQKVFVEDKFSWNNAFSLFAAYEYLSCYLSFSICILLFFMHKAYYKNTTQLLLGVLVVLLFFIIQLIIAKKLYIAISVVIFLITGAYYATTQKRILLGLSIVVFVIASVSFFLLNTSFLNDEVQNFKKAININLSAANVMVSYDSSPRVFLWLKAIKLLSENFILGIGTGEVTDVITQWVGNSKLMGPQVNLTVFNQYIQIFLSIGLIGVTIFLLSLLIPLILALKKQKYIYAFFCIITILVFCFYSMLEDSSGVVFYAFFNSLLISADRGNWKSISLS